jgi:arylsulfatase
MKRDATKPNIIVILVDDMGYSDMGCYGSEIETPNVDAMAAGGTRFTQAYNYARCCPSRACLLTGVYPHQAGVGHMVGDYGVPAYQGFLRDDVVTMAEALKLAGYRTMISGKWHVGGNIDRSDAASWENIGDPRHPLPLDRGFDQWYGTPSGAGSYFNPKPLYRDYSIIEPEGDDYYYTDAVTDNAMAMIEKSAKAEEPFFLYIGYTAPHWPLHAFEEDIAKYEGKYRTGWDAVRTARHEELKGMDILSDRWPISPRHEDAPDFGDMPHKDWEDRRMAVYAAQIDRMDQNIGRLTAKLRALGIEDDTLILFLSDNGGCAEFLHEDGIKGREWQTTRDGRKVEFGNRPEIRPGGPDTYQSYELPWANASNTPFRLFKHWVHEGGISTPLIVKWPKRVKAGQIRHDVVHIVDFMPTLLEAAGAHYPEARGETPVQPMEGESFLPALRGEDWQRDKMLFWEHEGNAAVRDGRWKLVRKWPGDWELYDMVEDRTELNDLAEKNKPQAERMKAQYETWAKRAGVIAWDKLMEMRRG